MQIIGVACNTVHAFIESMRNAVSVPIVSIVESTVGKILKDKKRKPLILSTPYTLKYKLYQNKFLEKNIDFVVPAKKDISEVFDIIKEVLKGKDKKALGKQLSSVINKYKEVDSLILACTELPLLALYIDTKLPIYDTLQILATEMFKQSQ